jgi:hypothetical protein
MRTDITLRRFFRIVLSLVCISPALVHSQMGQYVGPQSSDGPGFSVPSGKPSANNEIFKTLKTQCEADVACGKTSGDVCADAGAILIGNDPPDDLRGLPEVQRIKIALRLFEKGIDSSNLAASRAYDLYSRTDLLLGMTTGGYSDPYRANELMDLMTKRSYPGAALRKARTAVSFFSLATAEADKKQACTVATKLKVEGKLDVDSMRIANDVLDAVVCKAPATQPSQNPM